MNRPQHREFGQTMPEHTIAIIGASNDRRKFGNKAVRAYQRLGWTVYPVNPREPVIEGLQAYPSIRDVPRPLDRVSIYLLPQLGMKILPDLAAVGAAEVFFNPGSESPELLEQATKSGINAIVACSILDIGTTPAEYPSA
ncbi:MAG: CoA-binding protein [Candidatus Zixiibacteriota bacterium]